MIDPAGSAGGRAARAQPIDTVVVGGGQAGLAASYHLTRAGREHVVLEKDRVGEAWRSRRWDSFTLVTPNRQLQLPGLPYDGDKPDGFLPRADVVRYLDRYVAMFEPPLRLGVRADSLEDDGTGRGFALATSAGPLRARNVVVATGTFQRPRIPAFSRRLAPDVRQVHSSVYRNPDALPPGGVLVVGSGQSGCQIAEELYQSGRRVHLCTSSAGRAPRRYRGRDFTAWLAEMGFLDETASSLASPDERFAPNPHVSGANGGHSLNLHRFAKDGVVLLGHARDADGTKLAAADDLPDNLARADDFAANLMDGVDRYIEKAGIPAPHEDRVALRAGYDAPQRTELDLREADIRAVVWATGYRHDYAWIRFPVFDEHGYPVQERGVTDVPGLYFLGLHWLHTLGSGLFVGVGGDAAHVVEQLTARA